MFPADENMICAGRPPGENERIAIGAADATILPQGCRRELYEMARCYCPRVFPDYNARFEYPGKIGQIRLFRKEGVRFPASEIFSTVDTFTGRYRHLPGDLPYRFPVVLKFDWGGEGETVYLMDSVDQMEAALATAADSERAGLSGFLLQEFIPCDNRVLRVVVVGSKIISYWRVGPPSRRICVNVSAGAQIDFDSNPDHQRRAIDAVKRFSQATRINLAGFDLLYANRSEDDEPYFLEINYFFGRRGLGGSEAYYRLLHTEICKWLRHHGLALDLCSGRK